LEAYQNRQFSGPESGKGSSSLIQSLNVCHSHLIHCSMVERN
jgi:hypothetical protein